MTLDYTSLLLAVGFSGAALAVTLLGAWWSARDESFLLTWAVGITFIVMGVPIFGLYAMRGEPWFAAVAFVLFTIGLATIHGAAYQFRRRKSPLRVSLKGAVLGVVLAVGPIAAGYDAVSFMAFNTYSAGLLFASARQFSRARAQAPVAITGLIVLYVLTGVSFLLCTMMLVREGSLVLTAPPMNWAEDLNVITGIIGITGIGAISLSLHQTQLALQHRRDANTDPLTGLLNRRALFDVFGQEPVPPGTAVIVFDLDHFKAVNDLHGHGTGDDVLHRFAEILASNTPASGHGARHGGEEFALVLSRQTAETALAAAETIRKGFCAAFVDAPGGQVSCTVSAGVCFVETSGHSFNAALQKADKALYFSKRSGRNCVNTAELRLAA